MGKKSSPSGKKKTPDRVGKSMQQMDSTGEEVDGEVNEVKFLKFLEECMNDDVKTQRAVSSVRELVNIHQPILHVTLPKRIVSNNNADRVEWLMSAAEIIFNQVNVIPWAFSVKNTEKVELKQDKARLAHAVQQQQQLSHESPGVQQQQQLSHESPGVQQQQQLSHESPGVQQQQQLSHESPGGQQQQKLSNHLHPEESACISTVSKQKLSNHLHPEESACISTVSKQKLSNHLHPEESACISTVSKQKLSNHLHPEESACISTVSKQKLSNHLHPEESACISTVSKQKLSNHLHPEESACISTVSKQKLSNHLHPEESACKSTKQHQLHPSQMGYLPQSDDVFWGNGTVNQPSQMGPLSQRDMVAIGDKPVRHPAQRGGVSQRANEFNCDEPVSQPSQKGRLSQSDDEFMWDEPFGQLLQRSTALMRELNPEGRQQQQRRQVQPSQMGGVSQRANEFICDKPVRQPSQMGGSSQSDQLFNCDRPVSQPSQMGGLSQNDNVFICDSPVRQPSQRGGVSQGVNELICDKPVSQPAQTGRLAQSDKLLIDDKPVNQRSQMSVVSKYDANTHWEQHQQRHVSGEKSQRGMQETWADREVPSQMGGRSQTDNVRICDRPVGQPSQMSHVARYEQKYEEAQQQHQHQFNGAEHTEEEGAVAARYTRMKANASNRGATSRQYIREECREYQRQQEGYRTESWNMPGRTQERHAPAYEYPDVGYNKYDDHQVKWADGTSRGGGDDGERTKHQGIHRGYERVRLCGGTEVRGGADKLEETDNRFGWQETMGKMMDVWQKANEKQIEVWQRSSEKQVLATVRHDQFSGEDKAEFKYWFEDLLGRMEETCLTDDEKLRHLVGCLKGNAKRQFREDNVRPTWRAALQYLSEKYGNRYEKRSKEADRFHTRMQKSGESIREYAFALKRLCPIDEMNSYYEEYMTGQLIIGLQSARDREKATYEFEIKRTSFASIVKGIEDYEYCREKVNSSGIRTAGRERQGAQSNQREKWGEEKKFVHVKRVEEDRNVGTQLRQRVVDVEQQKEHSNNVRFPQQQTMAGKQPYSQVTNQARGLDPQTASYRPPFRGYSGNNGGNVANHQQFADNWSRGQQPNQPVQGYQQRNRLAGDRTCFTCGEVGHLQNSCWKGGQRQEPGSRPPQSTGVQAIRTVKDKYGTEKEVKGELWEIRSELAQVKHCDEVRNGVLSKKVEELQQMERLRKVKEYENEAEVKKSVVRVVSIPFKEANASMGTIPCKEAKASIERDTGTVRINGQAVTRTAVLFDTGADMNMISQNFANQLRVKTKQCNIPLLAVNMTKIACIGVGEIRLEVDGQTSIIECHVAPDMDYLLLVGRMDMKKLGVRLLSRGGMDLMWPDQKMNETCSLVNQVKRAFNCEEEDQEAVFVWSEEDQGRDDMLVRVPLQEAEEPDDLDYAILVNASDEEVEQVSDDTFLAGLKLGNAGSEEEKESLKRVLVKHKGAFSSSYKVGSAQNIDNIGKVEVRHRIETGGAPPFQNKERRLPYTQRALVQKMLTDLLEQNVIEHSQSPYASCIVLVRKADGSIRFCVDFRRLNQDTVADTFPLPHVADMLEALVGSSVYSALDIKCGFYNIMIEEKDKMKTAFRALGRLYQWRRMPFGLCTAPATFQRMIVSTLDEYLYKGVVAYMDDLLIYSKSAEEHVVQVAKVLEKLEAAGLRANPNKCGFFLTEVAFLGSVVSAEGVAVDPKKLTAIMNFPLPETKRELQSFIGLINYIRKHHHGLSVRLSNMQALIKGLPKPGARVTWTEESRAEFEQLKVELSSAPVLSLPMVGEPYVLTTDASTVGYGCMLEQIQSSVRKLIGFASSSTSDAESRYCATELELRAVVFGLNTFRVYLIGEVVTVLTDHQPLVTLMKRELPNPKMYRWSLLIQQFNVKIVYKPGTANVVADCLSRAPVTTARVARVQTRSQAQTTYEERVESTLNESGDDVEPETEEGMTYLADWELWEDEEPPLLVEQYNSDSEAEPEIEVMNTVGDDSVDEDEARELPVEAEDGHWVQPVGVSRVNEDSSREELIKFYHEGPFATHAGTEKVYAQMKPIHGSGWPSMKADIKAYIETCNVCRRRSSRYERLPWLPRPPPTQPRMVWSLDFTQIRATSSVPYALVCIDSFSRWVMVDAVKAQDGKATVRLLERLVGTFGVPQKLITDAGTHFTAQLVQDFINQFGILHEVTTTGAKTANAVVERMNLSLQRILAAKIADAGISGNHWFQVLARSVTSYNAQAHSALGGKSPFEVIFGVPFSASSQSFIEHPVMEEMWAGVRRHMLRAQRKNVEYGTWDREETQFEKGDLVWIQNLAALGQRKRKAELPNSTPGVVVEVGRRSANVECSREDGETHIRKVPLNWLQKRF